MSLSEDHPNLGIKQGGSCKRRRRRARSRRCLLKGCNQVYKPRHPLQRYCGAACRQKAKKWRLYKAQLTYRKSENGKEKRRRQCRERRARCKVKKATLPCRSRVVAGHSNPRSGSREGNRNQIYFAPCCDRPGCYERFTKTRRSPAQHFCCRQCRRALERVLERERRWKERATERKQNVRRAEWTIRSP